MTRTNQEVLSTVGLACFLDDRSLHGPCTRMTVCTWLKKRADFLHLPFAETDGDFGDPTLKDPKRGHATKWDDMLRVC